MSQMQMPSGIMWANRPPQTPIQNPGQAPGQPGSPMTNPAPTGQYPNMPQMGGPPQGMSQYPSLMQNAMQSQGGMGQSQGVNSGNASGAGGSPPSGYTPPPGFQPQGQTPGPGWMGNNIGSQPMGGQTPGMSPGSQTPSYPSMPQMPSGPTQGGSPFGANGQMSRTPTTNLGGPPQLGNMFPGGGMPQRPPGMVNQTAGTQFPSLAQNAMQSQPPAGGPGSTMTPGGNNSAGPISAQNMMPPNSAQGSLQAPQSSSMAPGSLPQPNVMGATGMNANNGFRGAANMPSPFMPGMANSMGGAYGMNAAAMSGANQNQSPQSAIAQWRATGQVPSWWNRNRGMANNQVGNANVNGSLNQSQ